MDEEEQRVYGIGRRGFGKGRVEDSG